METGSTVDIKNDAKRDASIGDEYILVRKGKPSSGDAKLLSGDTKDVSSGLRFLTSNALAPKLRLMRAGKTASGLRNLDPVSARLVFNQSLTSATNTFNSGVAALSPVNVQDWTGFAALFDECRVTAVEIEAQLLTNGGSIGNTVGFWAYVFDPANAGAYSNLSDAITAAHHKGPLTLSQALATLQPLAFTASGFYKLKAPVHPGRVTNDSSAAGLVGGGWFGTGVSASNSAIIGYLKVVAPAMGASVTTTVNYVITYHCEFRART